MADVDQSQEKAFARFPRWVYGSGEEPDPRFTFANERTFLAWIRTALTLIASGVAVEALSVPLGDPLRRTLALLLLALGLVCGAASWVRWARAERALRRHEPLPATPVAAALLSLGVISCVGLLVVGLW